MYYYHATTADTFFNKIIPSGKLKKGCDGIVYLTETAENALRFISLRTTDPIIVIKLKVPDENLVEETFDHSFAFFQYKSFGYPEDIPSSRFVAAYRYE